MDSVKFFFRQVSGGDYFIIILLGAAVYFLTTSLEDRQRFQYAALMVFIAFCVRVIFGVSFTGMLSSMINGIQFIYIWGPLSLSIFFTSMFYEMGNLKTIILRSVVASICICTSLYVIFT